MSEMKQVQHNEFRGVRALTVTKIQGHVTRQSARKDLQSFGFREDTIKCREPLVFRSALGLRSYSGKCANLRVNLRSDISSGEADLRRLKKEARRGEGGRWLLIDGRA